MLNLPNPKAYAKAWKQAKNLTDDVTYNVKLANWYSESLSAYQIRQQFRDALNRRINQRGGEEWRNHPVKGETDMYRDQRALHNWLQKRIICRRLNTPKLQRRFAHLLWSEE